jgi:hypothetical protein
VSAYAETTVAVEKSQSEVRALLAKHGATSFAFGEEVDDDGVRWALVTFQARAMLVRIKVPHKAVDQAEVSRRARRARSKTHAEIAFEAHEQEARRIWRVIAWGLKARMVSVEEGVETFEQAFLPHLVNPGTGRTVYEDLSETGTVELPGPLALPAGSPA